MWEIPRPEILSSCVRCGTTQEDIEANRVVVSPTGKAHWGDYGGITHCGIDTTGKNYEKWWWPL